jgi:hypothetical protein
MHTADDERDSSLDISGPGWKRLENGSYLWRERRGADTRVISEEAFLAIKAIRNRESLFAFLTCFPIAPAVVFWLNGVLPLTMFMALVIAIVVPNVCVNLYANRKVRCLVENAPVSQEATAFGPINVLRRVPDRELRRFAILLSVSFVACAYATLTLLPGVSLPSPPRRLSPYLLIFVLVMSGAGAYFVFQEQHRRGRDQRT